MKGLKIRRFELKDLKQVLSIESRSFKEPYPPDTFMWFFCTEPDGFLVAQLENRVVGYAIVSGAGHIISIAVRPEHRRQKIASLLLEHGLQMLRARGVKRALSEVRKSNAPAQSFFSKHGFKAVRIIPNYYRDEDGIVYELLLS